MDVARALLAVVATVFLSTACLAGSSAVDGVPLGEPFVLRPDDTVEVSGTGLRVGFRGVLADSRCPAGVQCVWAGDAEVEVELSSVSGKETVTLHTTLTPRSASHGGLVVRLDALAPQPVAGETIPRAAYRATFTVTREP